MAADVFVVFGVVVVVCDHRRMSSQSPRPSLFPNITSGEDICICDFSSSPWKIRVRASRGIHGRGEAATAKLYAKYPV